MCPDRLLCAALTQPSAKGLASHRNSKNIGQMKIRMPVPLNLAITEVPESLSCPGLSGLQATWTFGISCNQSLGQSWDTQKPPFNR